MKRFFRLLEHLLPHAVLILSLMMLTFFCIDLVNGSMAFLNNTGTKYLLAILSVLSVFLAVTSILKDQNH